MVLTETLNIEAIWDKLSPSRTNINADLVAANLVFYIGDGAQRAGIGQKGIVIHNSNIAPLWNQLIRNLANLPRVGGFGH